MNHLEGPVAQLPGEVPSGTAADSRNDASRGSRRGITPGAAVVVAMSGGVDSSVAALLLHEDGYQVVGVSMQVWDYRQHGGCSSKATCCAPDDFTDARVVASSIGVPYYVFDFERTFRREVIDRFVATYQAGRTPNPCIDCNSRVKFRELRDRARALGIPSVATGHYARIIERHGTLQLARGVDREKDQSYFLYGMQPEELANTLFPVGHLTKPQVREIAAAHGLVTATKPESQDICFVSGTTRDFVERIGGAARPGRILSTSGEQIGEHDGIHGFTVGQRRGLGVGGSGAPLYVLRIEAESGTVVVGPREELERQEFDVEEVNWVSPQFAAAVREGRLPTALQAIAQLRHRHEGVPVEIHSLAHDRVRVRFQREWTTVSPGQAAVFYDTANELVLGGGRIV